MKRKVAELAAYLHGDGRGLTQPQCGADLIGSLCLGGPGALGHGAWSHGKRLGDMPAPSLTSSITFNFPSVSSSVKMSIESTCCVDPREEVT